MTNQAGAISFIQSYDPYGVVTQTICIANGLLGRQDILKNSGNKTMTTKKIDFAFIMTKNALVLIVCMLNLAACFPQRNKDFNIKSPQTQTRTITNTTLPFHEQWRKSDLLLFNTLADRIYIYGNQLFFVNYDSEKASRLEVLNAKTGTLLWKTEPLPFSVNSLASDGERLYLALSEKIIVYNLLTGEVLWEDALLGDRTTYWVYPISDTLLVYSEEDISWEGDEEQVIRKYDPQSGLLISIDRITIHQNHSSLLLKTPAYDYWSDGKMLWAINIESKQEQWNITLEDRVEYQPVFIDSKLIFASGIFSDVVCVDNVSGHQIWKYENQIVSNLAAKQGVIYAIRTDATIVGIDLSTGKEIGSIGIEPRVTETSSRSYAYLIAVSEDMLFVYYGDSHELISFSK